MDEDVVVEAPVVEVGSVVELVVVDAVDDVDVDVVVGEDVELVVVDAVDDVDVDVVVGEDVVDTVGAVVVVVIDSTMGRSDHIDGDVSIGSVAVES